MDQGAEIVFILAEEAGCLKLQWHTSKKKKINNFPGETSKKLIVK